MAFTAKLLINGESVDGDGDLLAVQNPSTGSTICEVAEATAEQVEAAVRAAREAWYILMFEYTKKSTTASFWQFAGESRKNNNFDHQASCYWAWTQQKYFL